jgi:cytoskeleton protein RodZ
MFNESVSDFTAPPETPDASAESLGAWLARTRAGYGAEQRDVAHHLRLNPAIIQAIEADDFARLGPPVFVRGYLSRYAQLLNLPEQTVLERFRSQSGPSLEPPPLKVVHPLQRQTRVRDLRGLLYLVLVAGIGWFAVQHLGDLDPGRLVALWPGSARNAGGPTGGSPMTTTTTQVQYPFQSAPAEEAIQPPAPPPAGEPAPATRPEPAPPPAMVALQTPTPVAPASLPEHAPVPAASGVGTPAAAPPATDSPVETGEQNVAVEAGEGARLLLEFSNDCWVEVKDAQGNVLASGLMKANSTRILSGPAPFKVTLGNAPAARIVLDNRLVDSAVYVPRRGTVSRFTLDRGQP